MKKIYSTIGICLLVALIALGCMKKEEQSTGIMINKNIQKTQAAPQNIKESLNQTNKEQEILSELANTNALDLSLEELDEVE